MLRQMISYASEEASVIPRHSSPLFTNRRSLYAFFERVDRHLKEEIASRPTNLRLPRNGRRFRTERETSVEVVAYFRPPGVNLFLPVEAKLKSIPRDQVLRLCYDPDPSQSTHCHLLPERYGELEVSLIDASTRSNPEYAGYDLSVSYVQLDADFEWLEDK